MERPPISGVMGWVSRGPMPRLPATKPMDRQAAAKKMTGNLTPLMNSSVATRIPGRNMTQGTRARIHSPLKPVRWVVSSRMMTVVIGYDEKGLPKTKNVLAKTKRECQEKLKQLRETATGSKTEKVRPEMPFGEWLNFWHQNYVKLQICPTAQTSYEAKIYQHIIPELGGGGSP